MTEAGAAEARRIGKYVVKRELGRGGMGAVYLAEQPGLAREVAIKELIVNSDADPSAFSRFMQEAQVMARSTHPKCLAGREQEGALGGKPPPASRRRPRARWRRRRSQEPRPRPLQRGSR